MPCGQPTNVPPSVVFNNSVAATPTGSTPVSVVQDPTTGFLQASVVLPSFADNIIPAGAMDGVNNTFTLPESPNPPESLDLFFCGIKQQPTVAYSLTGASIVFTRLVHLPVAAEGDSLLASFRY